MLDEKITCSSVASARVDAVKRATTHEWTRATAGRWTGDESRVRPVRASRHRTPHSVAGLTRAAALLLSRREGAMAEQVNLDPRHGRAGRQPIKELLDKHVGNEDPGMFG